MKKIILLLIGLFLFIPTTKVFASSAIILDNFDIEITIKDKGEVDVKQKFSTSELDGFTEFSIPLSKNHVITDSNFMEVVDHLDPNTQIDDIAFLINLKDDQKYYLNYTIKSDNMVKQKQNISIIPLVSHSRYTEYKNFKFKIEYTENTKIDIEKLKQESKLEGFELYEEGNSIVGEQISSIIKDYQELQEKSPIIRFDAMIGGLDSVVSPSNFNAFKLQLAIMAMIIVVSLCKIITKNKVYNPFLIVLLIGQVIVFAYSMFTARDDMFMLLPLIFLIIVYGIFIASITFSKSIPSIVIRIPLILFIFFHSYMMFNGFNSGYNNTNISPQLFALYASIFAITCSYNVGNDLLLNKKNRS